jgi:hypothetical protein
MYAQPVAASGPAVIITGLSLPTFVAVDFSGDLYVVDQGCTMSANPGDCYVYKETLSSGTFTQSVVDSFTSAAPPEGVAVDTSGNVYIGVFGLGLYKETPSGKSYSRKLIGCAWGSITGVAVAGDGYIYVSSNGHVFRETASDTCATVTPVAGAGPASNLVDSNVAVGACGVVFVHQGAVPFFLWAERPSASGYTQSEVLGDSQVNGLAADSSGNFYFSSAGAKSVYMGSPGTPAYLQTVIQTGLTEPAGLAVDVARNVYVVDQAFNQIWKVTPPASPPTLNPCVPAPPTGATGKVSN